MRISKIEKIESNSCLYDIETADNHNFFANGILVHNSNFSFWLNSEGIRCAKRSGFIGIGEQFFNWETVRDLYEDHLKLLYVYCQEFLKTMKEDEIIELKDDELEVVLYGELFGGSYNHPEMEKDPTAMKVQKGVQYCPWNDFYAFDLSINGRLINYKVFEEFMNAIGFHYAKSLYMGSLKECLQYPNEFQTKIPEWLGLPPIEGNVCEGVVIKPTDPLFFAGGSRVILKNKNEKFSEVEKKDKSKKHSPDLSMSEEETKLFETGICYMNENRLRNVISKIGQITDKDFGKLQGLFTKDILDDFRKDNEKDLSKIESKRVRVIEKNINNKTQEYIRENFVNIIDGVF